MENKWTSFFFFSYLHEQNVVKHKIWVKIGYSNNVESNPPTEALNSVRKRHF